MDMRPVWAPRALMTGVQPVAGVAQGEELREVVRARLVDLPAAVEGIDQAGVHQPELSPRVAILLGRPYTQAKMS